VLLLALGLLLAQGPVLLHLLLVGHATCEHGELVEIAASRRHDASPRIEVNGADSAISASDALPIPSEHEHCDALAVRHSVPEVGAAVMAASLQWIEPIPVHGGHAETRPVPTLSLAPKGSPPVTMGETPRPLRCPARPVV